MHSLRSTDVGRISVMRTLVLMLVVGGAAVARADNVSDADALFAEGVKLKAAGQNTEACAKFVQTLKLNRNAVGAILNVALCDEEDGKYASATRMFSQARDLAREHDLAPELKAAEEHLQKNEPLIAHLAIAFAETPPDNTKLVIDDDVVPINSANDIPVDPGVRTITVTAPGRVPYETKITVAKTEHKAIAVPKLGYPVVVKKTKSTIGKVLSIGGVALIGTGVGVGLYARSSYKAEFTSQGGKPPNCQSDYKCNPTGYSNTHSALTLGWVGTGLGAAGIVAAGVGGYLWFFKGKDQTERQVSIVPTVDRDGAGVVAVGRF